MREKSPFQSTMGCWNCDSQSSKRKSALRWTVDAFIWLVIGLPILLLYKFGTPSHTGFFCDDESLRYPYYPDTISDHILITCVITSPAVILFITEVTRCLCYRPRTLCKSHMLTAMRGYCAFVFGFTVVETFIQGFKFTVGRLRPHFFEVCKPDFSKINCSIGYVTEYECTDTTYPDRLHRDSRQSFLSGHAAASMYAAIFTALYLEIRMNVKCSRVFKPVIQLYLFLVSVACSMTRYFDNKHHVSDIISGVLVGAAVAIFVHVTVTRKVVKPTTLDKKQYYIQKSDRPAFLGEVRTPTQQMLLRQDSSFTSGDSCHPLCNGHFRRTDVV